jgi:outer membrane protein, multidrug efflux system
VNRPRLSIEKSVMLPVAAALLACCGCTVGPDYEAPEMDMPASFGEAVTPAGGRQSSLVQAGEPVLVDWWKTFRDCELDSLVARAIAANHELRVATARVQEARAVERMDEARLYPTVGLSGGAFATRGSEAGFGSPYGLPGKDSPLFQIGFDASYEVDLFGGTRREIEAAGALAEASEDERRAVQVTLLGEVARNYIALRTLQRRLVVAHANLDDQRHTADIVQRRLGNGLATNLDLVRARSQAVATESSIPPIESGIRQRIHGLSTLLGEPPLALADELAADTPIPPAPPEVPIGLPSELLRRRPDVMRAERVLAAATAEHGVATAELFPHVILGGTAGVQSRHTADLFGGDDPDSSFHLAGLSADWTLFDGGRRSANIDRTKARVAEAAASYEATVLGALRDVENALSAYSSDQTRRGTLATLVDQNQEAVRIARNQFGNGLVALLDVMDVQRNLYSAQDALAQADEAVSANLVAIYKALGGGWETTVADATAATIGAERNRTSAVADPGESAKPAAR